MHVPVGVVLNSRQMAEAACQHNADWYATSAVRGPVLPRMFPERRDPASATFMSQAGGARRPGALLFTDPRRPHRGQPMTAPRPINVIALIPCC
jgi:hypothetical protein